MSTLNCRNVFKLAVAIAVAATFAGVLPASAHEDPPGCFETGPAIIVSVLRADGTTGVVGNVSECETINYRATLEKAQNVDSICAFAQGTFSLTTPDGVAHVINSNVPCIGGNTGLEGCDPTVTQVQSALIPYTVNPADVVGGLISAHSDYTGGIAHDSPANTAGVSATTPKSTPVFFCNDNDPCTIDTCDPTKQSSAACSHTPIVCNDNNACTTDTCVGGVCQFSAPKVCNDNNACTDDSCNPANGQCVFTPNIVCDDNNKCTDDSCNPANGQCVFTPNITCNDDNACTDDSCNPATGQCVFTPNITCNDNNACTDDSCNPANGQCVFTPNITCNDNNGCTADSCNPATGQCVFTPNVNCDDNNLCTADSCVPATGQCQHIQTVCNDNDPCTDDRCNPSTGQCEFTDNGTCHPSGCRVTGGGIVDACGPVPAGCDPSTGACAPDCDFAALDATHGGQVGAPIGTPTAFTPDSACIQGEWTHVRHIKPGTFGNFHANTFDSLMCACLPCAENPDSPGTIGALCNPGDRICGPEPRRAPDNKICFSGVGDYALSKGKRSTDIVVFRTDVEDRSEPGGGNGAQPPDRYRLRLWFIGSTNNLGVLGGPAKPGCKAYAVRQQVGCADPTTENLTVNVPGADPVPTPDIDDGGDLIHGNQQIHPSLKKTCP